MLENNSSKSKRFIDRLFLLVIIFFMIILKTFLRKKKRKIFRLKYIEEASTAKVY